MHIDVEVIIDLKRAARVAAVAAAVAGCASSAPQVTSAAPPTVVCGTVLNDSAAGAVLYDATHRLPTITYPTVGDLLFFRVAPGCASGVNVHWAPSSAAHQVMAAYARDGHLAAVVLAPTGPKAEFRLTGTRNGRVIASATVKLAS